MRAQSSVKVSSSLVIVVLALVSGCSPDEPRVAAVVPEPLAPEPELLEPELREPGQPPSAGPSQAANDRQELLNAIRVVEAHVSASRSDVLQSTPRKLVFECTDGVNF